MQSVVGMKGKILKKLEEYLRSRWSRTVSDGQGKRYLRYNSIIEGADTSRVRKQFSWSLPIKHTLKKVTTLCF